MPQPEAQAEGIVRLCKSSSPNLSSHGKDVPAWFLNSASFVRPSVKPVSASHEVTKLELWRRVLELLKA